MSPSRLEAGATNPLGGPAPIRAVLFDVDGTLYDQRPLRRRMLADLAAYVARHPLKGPRQLRALQAYRRAQETLRGQPQTSAAAQLDHAAAQSGVPVAELAALVQEWMEERPLRYVGRYRASGVGRLLDHLASLGLRSGVLSDYPAHAKLAALGLQHRFDPVLCSTDPGVGALKPDPAGFRRACGIWRLPPAEVLMVGDRIDVDAAGAAAAGMPCVIIGGAEGAPGGHTYLPLPSLKRLAEVLPAHENPQRPL